MNKEAKMVMVPYQVDKLEVGMLVHGINGKLSCVVDNMTIGYWENLWKPVKPFLVSDDEIKLGDLYIDDTNALRTCLTEDKSYWSFRKNYKKVIARPEQIGIIYSEVANINPYWEMEFNNLEQILANDGKCWIEMQEEQIGSRGIPTTKYYLEPKLIEGRVIIHLTEN